MQIGRVTTPFGRRPITLALVRRQRSTAEIDSGKTADKWKVYRDASVAYERLGLQSNSLAVLDALLSFYPEAELRQDAQMIVFPSNQQLCLRAHSMAGATLRRHLALLVESGLIIRKDSANGNATPERTAMARSRLRSASTSLHCWRVLRSWPCLRRTLPPSRRPSDKRERI